MNVQAYADFLLSHMANAKYASGRKFINCRCPECGDSMHIKSAHMYIFIPWDEDEASWYYCHKCHASSIVTYKKLLEWDIYDQNIASELQELNNKVSRNPRKSKYFNKEIYTVKHSIVTQNDKTEFKRQYVSNRLGYDFTCDDLARLKVILNLNDILYENNITTLTRNQNIVDHLSNEFVGFLSIDNAFLNMRKTCADGIVYSGIDKRYINYQIYDKTDTTQRFYCVPTKVNLNTTERIKFHISEGPFDILSVFINVRKGETGIYTCVAGSNYISVIMFFLIDMRIPNIELHFYPDNDKYGTDSAIWKIVNRIPDPTIPVYVHRNIQPGEKDFGVTPDRIKESITVLRKSIT